MLGNIASHKELWMSGIKSKESNRLKDNQHFQEPIEQSLEKSGDKIFTGR